MEPDQDEHGKSHAPIPSPSEADTDPAGSAPPNLPASVEIEKHPLEHDSMVTVRLSEPPVLSVITNVGPHSSSTKATFGGEYRPSDTMTETLQEEEGSSEELAEGSDIQELQGKEEHTSEDSSQAAVTPTSDSEEVDWVQLQEKEDEQSKYQQSDNTALLLARLEQENAKFATNPNTVQLQAAESPSRQPRPPSMAQLKDMVREPPSPALRYSMLPPPPMTDLEFYAALVKDYQQTAARLPTLLSNKIRKGIPPPLRGVVWQSMSGSRDLALEEQFERFCGESSPYEGVIGKDLGRSFPGVEMFRDPEGDGQRMLGRVLKCYSLHEPKIGYCQGLGLLVGPLLMHMPDKQAFCVLVKLMEDYGLRNSYTPDLSGLHVRIYQFRELLRQHLPLLSSHLDDLQVDPAYVSQWFLSFFAVTSPLPMLFRIFDVIFAEGASETIMRVALSLMQKNQGRILACSEMEDVMQLLLSRGLWDCYHYNADEFVQDFTNLSDVVNRERLAALEQGYREAQSANSNSSTNAARMSDVSTAASRFLGRLWTSAGSAATASNTSNFSPKSSAPTTTATTNPSTALNPGLAAPPRPLSMLRRSTSKQSLASTLNSMEASSSSSSVLSSTSTEATFISRDSSASEDPSTRGSAPAFNGMGSKSNAASNSNNHSDSRYLHSQIEDLLTALSDLQRQHALFADELQREREERAEDQKIVRPLLDALRKRGSTATAPPAAPRRKGSESTIKSIRDAFEATDGSEELFRPRRRPSFGVAKKQNNGPTDEQLSSLVDAVEQRFGTQTDNRRSSIPQTKTQLRDELARAKEQLSNELAKGQDNSRRVQDMEQELATTKDQLRESHAHVRNLHQDKQRLERQMHGMKGRASADPSVPTTASAIGIQVVEAASDWFGRTNTGVTASAPTPAPGGGLRELKLGRSRSTPSQASNGASMFNKRTSSLFVRGASDPAASGTLTPPSEHEALLLDLVQAKTAEAVARQEADEAKQRLENMRKAFGIAPQDVPSASHNSTMAGTAASTAAAQASAAASAAMGMIGRFTTSMADANASKPVTAPAATPPGSTVSTSSSTTSANQSGYGGFFGWRRT